MNPVPAEVSKAIEDIGRLTNNYRLVESLRSALGSGEHAYKTVPMLAEEVLEEDAWRERAGPNGKPILLGPDEFIRFIESPAPDGLGTTLAEVRKYLGAEGPTRLAFEAAVMRKPGGPNNPYGRSGKPEPELEINPNNIRVDSGESDPTPSPPPRDRSREPQAGTSIGATVRRFERKAPHDEVIAGIYDRLKAGEISANAAAVLAGFRPKAITIPAVPGTAGRLLARHFTREQFSEMVDAALSAYGVDRPRKMQTSPDGTCTE